MPIHGHRRPRGAAADAGKQHKQQPKYKRGTDRSTLRRLGSARGARARHTAATAVAGVLRPRAARRRRNLSLGKLPPHQHLQALAGLQLQAGSKPRPCS